MPKQVQQDDISPSIVILSSSQDLYSMIDTETSSTGRSEKQKMAHFTR
jgi:hypothetical protein